MTCKILVNSTAYLAMACVIAITACKHEPLKPAPSSDGDFPGPVANIFITKCATASCHNAATARGGIRLDNWDRLFDGGNNGAVVVPYSPQYSSLLYFINTDSSLGPVAEPRMPQGENGQPAPPLTREEYMTIRSWIEQGCPDKNGKIPFSDNADSRQKIYMTMQGCNVLGVIDAGRKVVMRYIQLGAGGALAPHCVRVSADGKYACVSYYAGNSLHFDRINTTTDKIESGINIGQGSWNILCISPDSKEVALSDYTNGRVVVYDMFTGAFQREHSGLSNPHGISGDANFDTLYITGQLGNTVYKVDRTMAYNEKISIDNLPPGNSSSKDPHEIMMSPDHKKYFVSCQTSNEIRIMDTHANTLLDSVNIGKFPQELAISRKYPYLFVSCSQEPMPEFSTNNVKFQGAVYVINYNTHELVKVIRGRFSLVHGLTVDDEHGLLFFASQNIESSGGPPPHHTTTCGGRNGYYNVYDLNTLEPAPSKRYEVLSDPYSVDSRFK